MLSRTSMLPSKWESWNFQLHIWKNVVKLHLNLDSWNLSNWETLWNKFWVHDQNKIKCINYSNFLQFQSLFSKILQREFKTVNYALLVDIQFGMSDVKNADLLSFTPPSKPQWLEIWKIMQEYPKHNLDRRQQYNTLTKLYFCPSESWFCLLQSPCRICGAGMLCTEFEKKCAVELCKWQMFQIC